MNALTTFPGGTIALQRAIHLSDRGFSSGPGAPDSSHGRGTDACAELLDKAVAMTDSFQQLMQTANKSSCCDESREVTAVCGGSFEPEV
jgi:hypothetical protein